MPKIEAGGYLIDYLFEIGLFRSGAMGAVPLVDADLIAWCHNQDIELNPWECRTILSLSKVYVSGLTEYKPAITPAPYTDEIKPENVSAGSDAIRNWAQRMAKKQ